MFAQGEQLWLAKRSYVAARNVSISLPSGDDILMQVNSVDTVSQSFQLSLLSLRP